MFDFVGAFFQKAAVSIGTALIAFGGLFAGTTTVEISTPQAVEETEEAFVSQQAAKTDVDSKKEDVSKPVTAPKQDLVDLCNNIEGIQTVVPDGFLAEGSSCTAITVSNEPIVKANTPALVAKNVGGTIYEGYGSYGFDLVVTAGDSDVFIPRTTSDSTSGFTGFVYTIQGQEFRGSQSSDVSCSIKYEGFCKVRANTTSLIEVTVWLTPAIAGNYGISFNRVNYLVEGDTERRAIDIDKGTELLYIW